MRTSSGNSCWSGNSLGWYEQAYVSSSAWCYRGYNCLTAIAYGKPLSWLSGMLPRIVFLDSRDISAELKFLVHWGGGLKGT